jgi:ElaB/YqjD/DUF883 family membrane-anchored ribosome-binding protein
MFGNKSLEKSDHLASQAEQAVARAVSDSHKAAAEAHDSVTSLLHGLSQQAAPLIERTTERVSTLVHDGVESARDTSRQLRDRALQASHITVNYIKDEPVKAILIAAAVGAALMALTSLLSHKRDRN